MRIFNFSGIKNRLKEKMDITPFWIELFLLIALVLIFTTSVMSVTYFIRNRSMVISNQKRTSREILELKMTNLEDYLEDLADFSLLPVFDSTFYSNLQSQRKLSDSTLKNVQNSVRTFFYTRKDLLSYHIHLLNQRKTIGRSYGQSFFNRHETMEELKEGELYQTCKESDYNYAVLPSNVKGAVFRYGHAMIRLPDREIVALVEFDVKKEALKFLDENKGEESICLFDGKGRMLYTDLESYYRNDAAKIYNSGESSGYLTLNDKQYLTVFYKGAENLTLVSLIPVDVITAQLKKSQIISWFTGVLSLLLSFFFAYKIIRYLLRPLGTLAAMHSKVGSGEFSHIDIGGCLENKNLSDSYNYMIEQIQELIEKNYAAELNEKTSRLAALEAQVNPHFLYNTLQAIGTEALLNDEEKIYTMLVSLASNLRYSIKAPNSVPLCDEIKYTDNYIMLQQVRMGDRLKVTRKIDRDLLNTEVPKISIQPLVENSIKHGISGKKDSISIVIEVVKEEERLIIRVRDDGVGICDEELGSIRESFREQTITDSNIKIGIVNLYNRIKLMYKDSAELSIETSVVEPTYTEVSITLPLRNRVLQRGE